MKNNKVTENNEKLAISHEPREKSSFGMRFLKIFIAFLLVTAIAYFGFTFEVREGNCAVVLRFGAPRAEITESGLYFRLPWPFENVVQYENRMQYLESNAQETVTKDKRNIILSSYVIWQVEDPLLFHNSVGAYGSTEIYIDQQIRSATQSTMGACDLTELVSLDTEKIKTEEIQQKIFEKVKENCEKNYGISIIDVSILRLSLPDINLQSVFDQMRQDRQTDIDTILAQAEKTASQIQADAEIKANEILAEGTNEAGKIKAETEKAPDEPTYIEIDFEKGKKAFFDGVVLNDGTVLLSADLEKQENGDTPTYKVIIKEGKYHQVKRMFASLGNKVLELRRVKMGGLSLDGRGHRCSPRGL